MQPPPPTWLAGLQLAARGLQEGPLGCEGGFSVASVACRLAACGSPLAEVGIGGCSFRPRDWRVFVLTSAARGSSCKPRAASCKPASQGGVGGGQPCSQPPPMARRLAACGSRLAGRTPWGARVVFWWLAGSQLAARGSANSTQWRKGLTLWWLTGLQLAARGLLILPSVEEGFDSVVAHRIAACGLRLAKPIL